MSLGTNEQHTTAAGSTEAAIDRVGVIESDLFCEACGFNMHTQAVWRDERLGILVCRCPECGRHHAASEKTTATNAWLRRVALLGAMIWGLLAVGFTLGVFGLGIGIHAATDEGLTYRNFETLDGRPVTWSFTGGATGPQFMLAHSLAATQPTTVPTEQVVMRRRLVPWLSGVAPANNSYMFGRPPTMVEAMFIGLALIIPWYTCAVIFAAGTWFWRPSRRWLLLLLPLLSSLTVYILITRSDSGSGWANVKTVNDVSSNWLIAFATLVTVAVMAFGLATGRPVMRFLLMIFMPPKVRQLFAFLWHCDGKTMPAPKTLLIAPPRGT